MQIKHASLNFEKSNIIQTNKALDSLGQQKNSGNNKTLLEDSINGFVQGKGNTSTFDNKNLKDIARNIRMTDLTITTIESYIEKMKDQLLTIVKNYPPFPIGSEDRVKFLNNYIGLKRQIEKLTIPPKETETVKINTDLQIVTENKENIGIYDADGKAHP